MKTKNILLATGLTISPISSNSPTYARNGIYLGYPTIMNLNKR